MNNKPYVIRVSSQKGGVGKTTIAVNLATELGLQGNRVLIIDTDFINPSIGFHMGVESNNAGVRAVMTGRASINNALVVHAPTGVHVLPGEIKAKAFMPTNAQFKKFFDEIAKTNYDFVVIDTPPGFLFDEDIKAFGEALIITTPEMSACTSAVRLANHYEKLKVKHSLVVNKYRNRRYELHMQEIRDMYGDNIAVVLPEDEIIPISIAEHIPGCIVKPESGFANQIKTLAYSYTSKFGSKGAIATESMPDSGIIAMIIKIILGLFGK